MKKMENGDLDEDRDSKEIKDSKEIFAFKFKPVLRRTKYDQRDSSGFLKFKKTVVYQPFVNCIESIYLNKEAKSKKKFLTIKPFERKNMITVYGPVLGKKPEGEKRSFSVEPVKKKIPNSFVRYDDLTLPILTVTHKKYKSREI